MSWTVHYRFTDVIVGSWGWFQSLLLHNISHCVFCMDIVRWTNPTAWPPKKLFRESIKAEQYWFSNQKVLNCLWFIAPFCLLPIKKHLRAFYTHNQPSLTLRGSHRAKSIIEAASSSKFLVCISVALKRFTFEPRNIFYRFLSGDSTQERSISRDVTTMFWHIVSQRE